MSELNIQQQQQLSQYLKSNPSVSKEQALVLLFGNPKVTQNASGKGVTVEKTSCASQGKTTSAEVSYFTYKASDGKTYNINKTFEKRINNVTANLKNAEDKNGVIGSAWSGFKNLTGIGDGSDKVKDIHANEQKLLAQFNAEASDKPKIFEQLTGQKYTPENLEKFIKGEIALKSELALNAYNEGQAMAVDVTADIVSGVAAVGIYTAAVAAAPFTGGTSIAVGVAAATASGAAIKAGVKYADAKTGGREYDSLGKDMATGAFSGALAPVTAGFGGAVGKTVATKLGVQAVKTFGKEAAEEVVETGVKQTIKTALANPAGYEYVSGSVLKKGAAYAAEMASDGAVGGAIDNSFRTAVDGGSLSDVAEAAEEGFIGGALLSPIIGGGFKETGKLGRNIVKKTQLNELAKDVPNKLSKKELSGFLGEIGYVEKDGVLIPDRKIKADKYSKSLSKQDAEIILKRLQMTLNQGDLEYIHSVVNACDGKFIDYWKSNPEELILFSGNLKKFSDRINENFTENNSLMENMINSIQNKPFGATLDAFVTFQNEYGINFLLRDLKKGNVTIDNVSSHPMHARDAERYLKNASKMQSHIEKQRTSQPMTLYRGDSPNVFEAVKFEDGTDGNLLNKIESILSIYDKNKFEELKKLSPDELKKLSPDEIQNLQNAALKSNHNWKEELTNLLDEVFKSPCSVEMPGFMSATISKKEGELFGKSLSGCTNEFRGVLWNLDVPQKSKCVCIDVIDPYAVQPEGEFLFQRDTRLNVKQAKLEKIDGYYYIVLDADVVQ